MDSSSIEDAVSKCLSRYCIDGVVVKKLDCTKLRYMSKAISCSGVYVFSGNNTVYYVGQSSNLYRRLVNEHCSASIGSSEGVVRFLMYLLDRVCSSDEVFREVDVKKREAIVKSIIKSFINDLTIYVGYCRSRSLKKYELIDVEKCIKRILKPLLNS